MMGLCCGCLPMRLGVLLYAGFVLGMSFSAVATIVTEDTRVLVGGYSASTGFVVRAGGIFGMVFSLGALLGVTDNASSWVRIFAHFALLARFPLVLTVAACDMVTLQGCEHLSFSGGPAQLNGGYRNVALETVALSRSCEEIRVLNLVARLLDGVISAYGVYMTYHWCNLIDHSPRYQISLDETRPLRIYTGFRYPPLPKPNHGHGSLPEYTAYDPPPQAGRL